MGPRETRLGCVEREMGALFPMYPTSWAGFPLSPSHHLWPGQGERAHAAPKVVTVSGVCQVLPELTAEETGSGWPAPRPSHLPLCLSNAHQHPLLKIGRKMHPTNSNDYTLCGQSQDFSSLIPTLWPPCGLALAGAVMFQRNIPQVKGGIGAFKCCPNSTW